jgi:hypothetical protein
VQAFQICCLTLAHQDVSQISFKVAKQQHRRLRLIKPQATPSDGPSRRHQLELEHEACPRNLFTAPESGGHSLDLLILLVATPYETIPAKRLRLRNY